MGPLDDELEFEPLAAAQLGCDLTLLMNRHARWSQKQFGSDDERGPVGLVQHPSKEALDAYADCLLLLLGGIRRAGMTLEQVIEAANVKVDINGVRTWPESKDGGPCEHIKEEER